MKGLVGDAQVIAVICNQWGDTGKGKFSDYFGEYWADVIARGTGGNNAGHTVMINGVERIYHLLPSGITQDANGKVNILGNGMVIPIGELVKEMDSVLADGGSLNHLAISEEAQVIMPYHVVRDQGLDQSQKKGGIGTTGRGIGPAYGDKTLRKGLSVKDLLDRETAIEKIEVISSYYPEQEINPEKILDEMKDDIERIRPHVKNTRAMIHKFISEGKKILIEGAQGLLLSVEHGNFKFCTSSDPGINGTASGVGLPATMVDKVFGIVKYPFMTRVGGGPFPTELGGRKSEKYCNEEHSRQQELEEWKIPHEKTTDGVKYDPQDPKIVEMMNSGDEFTQGIGIRLAAGEYGATTGRPRRTGWIDGVAARYGVQSNGPLMILTKADAIGGIDEFKMAVGYEIDGETTEVFSRDPKALYSVKPIYKTYEGYGDISNVREFDNLPASLKKSIEDLEKFTGGRVVAVSVGAERDATIIR